jgi:uncharacterized protein
MSKIKLKYISIFLPILIIRIYQHVLSPEQSFWGKRTGWKICRFHPTCSQYAIDALKKYGVMKGSYLATKRVFRCHPWNPGGEDPVT